MRLDVKCLVWYVGHAGQRLIIIIINYLIMVIQFLPLLSRWWVESTYVLWNSKLCSLLIIWRGSLNYFPKGNSLAYFFFFSSLYNCNVQGQRGRKIEFWTPSEIISSQHHVCSLTFHDASGRDQSGHCSLLTSDQTSPTLGPSISPAANSAFIFGCSGEHVWEII